MRHLSFIMPLLAAFAIAITGCSGSGTARGLLRAEAVMEENPDSAFRILEAIRTDSLRPALSREDSAKFALLYTQAQVKRKVPVADDSLISVAVRHYSARKDSPDLMKSLFYKAEVECNRGDMTAAIVPAMRARELAIGFDDSYWRAKAAELISDICSNTYYEEESVRYTEEAVEHYKKAGKTRNHLFALCDLATVRSNFGVDDNRNIALLDSVRRIALKEPADSTLIAYADRTLLEMYVDLGRNKEASMTLKELLSLNGHFSPNIRQYAYIARLALNNGDEEEAIDIIKMGNSEKSRASQKVNAYSFYRDYYKSKGMSREAEAYTDSILTLQNMEVAAVLKQSVVSAQRDFFTARAEKEADKARLSAMTASVLGVLLAAVCIGFILYYREKMRRKKAEIENRMKDILILSQEIEQNQKVNQTLSSSLSRKEEEILRLNETLLSQKNNLKEKETTISSLNERLNDTSAHDRLREEMEELFKVQWKTINILCDQYFDKNESEQSQKSIVQEIEKEIRKFKHKKNQQQIKAAVNKYMDGIIDRLQAQCRFLNEENLLFIALIYAGLSPRAVSLMTGLSLTNYYTRRHRLIAKINDSDAHDKDTFVSKMRK